jgi:hypothetical protein
MANNQYQPFEVKVSPLLGTDTASAPTTLAKGRWRYQINAYQNKIGSSTKRPGSAPVTNTALGALIKHLTVYRSGASETILGTSGTSLYKYDSSAWSAATGSLTSADIQDVDFTNADLDSRKLIADGGSFKEYNAATHTVSAVTPAADDPDPAPGNALADINAKGPKYIFTYFGQVFLSDGKDVWYYSKPYEYDYFPETQFERWVRNNDYFTGNGVVFDNVVLLPMRKGWGILTGKDFDDIEGNLFLNTSNGCIAPRSIQKVTYPNGSQTVLFLSDDGVYEIYDTGYLDVGSRRYSTRSKMANIIDFTGIGFTDAEKSAASSYYDPQNYMYMLCISRDTQRLMFGFDTRNGEWYLWTNIRANGLVRTDALYYAGETGHLHKFDTMLYRDWNEVAKTTGTIVDWDCLTDLIAFEKSGYASYLDYLVVSSKQYDIPSSIDVEVRALTSSVEYENAINNEIMIWGLGTWGIAGWYNPDFSELVGKPKRLVLKKRSVYFQIRFRNNRDEPCELYDYSAIGRVSGR